MHSTRLVIVRQKIYHQPSTNSLAKMKTSCISGWCSPIMKRVTFFQKVLKWISKKSYCNIMIMTNQIRDSGMSIYRSGIMNWDFVVKAWRPLRCPCASWCGCLYLYLVLVLEESVVRNGNERKREGQLIVCVVKGKTERYIHSTDRLVCAYHLILLSLSVYNIYYTCMNVTRECNISW